MDRILVDDVSSVHELHQSHLIDSTKFSDWLTLVMKSIVLFVALLALASAVESRDWMNKRDSPAVRAQKLLSHMTLDEKIVMLHGPVDPMPCCECDESYGPLCNYTGNVYPNTRLGIPQIKMNDGPQGFRDGNNPGTSTAWPSAMTVGATWDVDLVYQWGKAMGLEFWGKGANVQLGPGVNVARVPRNGRNFEYISGEDPFLGYTLVQPAVQGIQSQGVIANAKHYVLNNQETNRITVSDNADERTRYEMYLMPFMGAVEAGVGSFMCSYNKIFGDWACENNMTLNEDLKGRLDYKYFVMSDWGGTHSPSIRQGLDMEMPGAEFMGATISQMVNNGSLATSYIDDSVLRILTPMFQMGVFDLPNPNKRSANVTSEAHNDLARKLSAASTVLLKNDKNILPINVAAKPTIAVLGLADQTNCITHGDGSGSVSPARVISPLMGISNRLGQSVSYTNGSDIAAAIQLASEASFAIVFVGATSTEGQDRADLNVKANGDDLVFAVAKANPNTIVVVSTPGMILMPWASVVPAILTNMMPGQEVGNAIADILFGDVNPSGRLSFTMPNEENEQNMSQSQWPGLPASNPAVAEYSEGLFFGYRYYDQNGIVPLFPFGHGLSYTSFAYDSLQISALSLSFSLSNVGVRAGDEVWQLYIGFPAAANEPPKVLRGFNKVHLEAGGSTTEYWTLTERDLSIWDAEVHGWQRIHGNFSVFIGASSRDVRLHAVFQA